MKKVFKLFTVVCFVAALACMSSCTKSQEDLIIGSWKATTVTSEPANPFAMLLNGTVFTFNADNTFSITIDALAGEGTTGTYTIADNKLSMTSEGETIVGEIKTLDKKKLVFSMVETDEDVTMTITFDCDKQ